MTDTTTTTTPAALLDGYLTEAELSAATNKSIRSLRQYRQQQIGPPWVNWGNRVLYPRDGFLAYLKSMEQAPRARRGKKAA